MTTPSYKPTAQPSQGTRDTSNSTSTQFLYYTLALVAIIASVCFISFCYRSLFLSRFFSCGKNVDPNVEVIIETDAVIELEANYASADTCPADDVIFAGIASSTKAKSYVHSDASIFYAESPAVLVTTIAQESSMGDNDNTRARIIGVMDNVQLVSSTARYISSTFFCLLCLLQYMIMSIMWDRCFCINVLLFSHLYFFIKFLMCNSPPNKFLCCTSIQSCSCSCSCSCVEI